MDYENLSSFYLGKEFDLENKELKDEIVLYDSKDLTTHAVIIGMTGSGKTGLGIDILEEALVDNIPIIAIDPKGDMANLLLTFPDLAARDFEPWVNEYEASAKGMSIQEYAKAQAELWEKGLASWQIKKDRIAKLRSKVDMNVYTPGSNAGLPINVLRSFNAPNAAVLDDSDLFRERVQTTATSILALLDIEADPITSKEHILLSNILEKTWINGKNLDIASLIREIQEPPFERVGIMNLEQFYPAKERFGLAMRLNNLLASPGFEAWLEGEPLDIQKMLFSPNGNAKASIFSIAHLSDNERMFFVSMLLNEMLSWMRAQSGTSSLRAILYMDEIFGYLPPSKNPPSKTPMLTLLKQARAFGLGLVLSTQNPVDLDYKALSNAGTWFIGRLQTERDKERVLAGLQSASPDSMDKKEMAVILSALGKRVFLLHNVHEDAPVIFQTRWAMSYLAGPLTREKIKRLMHNKKTNQGASQPKAVATASSKQAPIMPQGVPSYYLSASGSGSGVIYYPAVAGFADIYYSSVANKVELNKPLALASEITDDTVAVDWDEAIELDLQPNDLEQEPMADADFAELSPAGAEPKNYGKWQKMFLKHIRQNYPLRLFKNPKLKIVSKAGESESGFRARLAHAEREKRDTLIEKMRAKYATKLQSLETKLMRAEQRIAKEEEQAAARKMDTMVNIGSAVFGALLGRKKVSSRTVYGASRAIKSASRMQQEQMDVGRAIELAEDIRLQLADLENELSKEIEALETKINADDFVLEPILVKPRSTNITLELFALVWLPYRKDAKGRLQPDWV